ncbi:chloride channel protein [Paramuribaculum intestinale]|uniref:chloride channel protein n=1 Tax=Paramuribaculum intestinale TaxID=2094151 RepID=UPI00272D78B2|nr:chloride channel protein [Paramuribaculum intestinale]
MDARTTLRQRMLDSFNAFLRWREKHIKEKTFVIILSLIVGIIGGFAALVLKTLIHFISGALTSHLDITEGNYLFFIYPVVGILITILFVKYVVRDNISHGVTKVLYAISQNKSRLKRHNMYSSLLASSITIGFGGSVGAEGPIVYTGAAIGSNLGSWMRLSPRVLMILVGCGAAAGIAGIFKAPIAGMLFTLEVLMIDLTTVSVMPLLIASITGATIAYVFTGYDVEFFFIQSEPFATSRIPFAILLGIFTGLVSLYFTRVINVMENYFSSLKKQWLKFAAGGAMLSVLVFIFPPLYGEGYGSIVSLLGGNVEGILDGSIFYADRDNMWFILGFIALIILTKVFATSATTGSGGIGGTFAPSLYVGCMAGFFFASLINHLFGLDLSVKNFALMGMCGVMSGVMHAPLMGIFLTAELTGGYELFLPLLIVSTLSYGTIKMFEPYSIYAMRLAQRGELLTHHKDKAVLTLLKINNVIETDFISVRPEMSLKEMVEVISKSNRNLFPVVDESGRLLGVVLLDEIRNIMFRPDLYRRMFVHTFMSMPPASIEVGESMERVMKIFDDTGAWNLPVVEGGRYVGFVSKSKIFNSYRRVLRHYSED